MSRRFARPARSPLRSIFRSRPSSRSTASRFRSGCRWAYSAANEPSPLPNSRSNGCGRGKRAAGSSGSRMDASRQINVGRGAARLSPAVALGFRSPPSGNGRGASGSIGKSAPFCKAHSAHSGPFPDEQRQRSGVAVQKIAVANRSDFAVAEKAGQPQRSELLLNQSRVVVGMAEQQLPPAIATAQAPAIDRGATEFPLGARQQRHHVLRGSRRVPALKLDGLSETGKRANGDGARARIGADEVAHEKIAALEVLPVLVDDEADEQVALRGPFFGGGEFVEGLQEDFVSEAVPDSLNEVAINLGYRPSFANGSATLGNNAFEPDIAAERDRH